MAVTVLTVDGESEWWDAGVAAVVAPDRAAAARAAGVPPAAVRGPFPSRRALDALRRLSAALRASERLDRLDGETR